MNKKTLAFTFGSAIVTALATGSIVHAQENPFGMQKISNAGMVAAADEKVKEGKCGEGKCGAGKSKMKESGDAMSKDKMKEGTDTMPAEKMKDGAGAMPAEKTKEANPGGKM
jgi:uncharacterized low-complexity protein